MSGRRPGLSGRRGGPRRCAVRRPACAGRAAAIRGRRGRGSSMIPSRGPAPCTIVRPKRLPSRVVRTPNAVVADERQVALLPGVGAEMHRRGEVDDRVGGELPVGDDVAHVRHGGACGHRPVHPAHVVAEPVLAALGALAAVAGQQAEMVAVQQALEPPADQSAPCAAAGRRRRPGLMRRPIGAQPPDGSGRRRGGCTRWRGAGPGDPGGRLTPAAPCC